MLYRFERCTLDLRRGCLRVADQEVRLRPKSFNVLRYFVENAGRLISKEELAGAVWCDSPVSDETLTRCLSDVRTAIGDRGQEIIKTVPRRGYLLGAPVIREPTTNPDQPAPTERTIDGPRTLALPDRPSIAVLPFASLSGEPQDDYFADGTVEDIITELTRFSELFVIAANSSFRFRAKSPDVREVGRELAVRYVLEGSIRRTGDRVRIAVQLIDSMTGVHRWAERYDHKLADIFAVQDEVARTIAAVLASHINKAEVERTLLTPPATWQAYDLYLRAASVYAHFHRPMKLDLLREASSFVDQCLTAEPTFARAHVLRSSTRLTNWALPLDKDFLNPHILEASYQAADAGVQFDPLLPAAHAQRGYALSFKGRSEEAVAEYERAIALNRNFTDWRFGSVLIFAGFPERAIEVGRAHLRVDPFALPLARGHVGFAHYMAGKYEEAVAILLEFVSQAPNHRPGRMWLAAAYAQAGHLGEARAQIAEVQRMFQADLTRFRQNTEHWYRRKQDFEHLADGLRKAGFPDK